MAYKHQHKGTWSVEVLVPTDLHGPETTLEELGQAAIEMALDEAPDYAMPARWEAVALHERDGWETLFRVTRYSA